MNATEKPAWAKEVGLITFYLRIGKQTSFINIQFAHIFSLPPTPRTLWDYLALILHYIGLFGPITSSSLWCHQVLVSNPKARLIEAPLQFWNSMIVSHIQIWVVWCNWVKLPVCLILERKWFSNKTELQYWWSGFKKLECFHWFLFAKEEISPVLSIFQATWKTKFTSMWYLIEIFYFFKKSQWNICFYKVL